MRCRRQQREAVQAWRDSREQEQQAAAVQQQQAAQEQAARQRQALAGRLAEAHVQLEAVRQAKQVTLSLHHSRKHRQHFGLSCAS